MVPKHGAAVNMINPRRHSFPSRLETARSVHGDPFDAEGVHTSFQQIMRMLRANAAYPPGGFTGTRKVPCESFTGL